MSLDGDGGWRFLVSGQREQRRSVAEPEGPVAGDGKWRHRERRRCFRVQRQQRTACAAPRLCARHCRLLRAAPLRRSKRQNRAAARTSTAKRSAKLAPRYRERKIFRKM